MCSIMKGGRLAQSSLQNTLIINSSILGIMFHILQSVEHCFSKKETLQARQIIPLDHSQLLVIFREGIINHYQLTNHQILKHMQQPQFKSILKAIAVSATLIVLLIRQGRKLMQLDLQTYDIKLIGSLEPYNYKSLQSQISQKESLTTANPTAFFKSVSFFFKEQIYEQRRVKIRFFNKKDQQWSSVVKDRAIGIQNLQKFDQISKVVLYKQDIAQNGVFPYRIITAEEEEQQIQLKSVSFTPSSIVKQVRSINNTDTVVCVNQRQPQIMYFKKNLEHHSYFMQTILFRLFVTDSYVINMNYSDKQRMQLRDINLKLIDSIQDNFYQITSSPKADWLVSYQKQSQPSYLMKFRSIKIVPKQALYMHLMSNYSKNNQISTSFCRLVLDLLHQ